MSSLLRKTIWGVSALAITLAAGCSRSELQDYTPPSSSYVEAPPAPPPLYEQRRPGDLLGGPSPDLYRPAPAPYVDMPPEFGAMAPIPNPEDMDPIERAEVYGDKGGAYARAERRATPDREARTPRPMARQAAAPQRGGSADPEAARPSGPVTSPKAAVPVPSKNPAKPVAQSAPSAASNATAPANPAAPQNKAEQLGAALASEVASKSTLDVPPAIIAGEEGVVVLTVPNGLLDRVREEARKLGLGGKADDVDIRAKLSGEGYVVIPDDVQTARLQKGKPTSFSWQVTPGSGDKGALQAQVDGALSGSGAPVTFPLGAVTQSGADENSGETITVPDAKMVTIPGIGPVRSGVVLLVGLALLAILILAAVGRNARERRRATQRERAREARADFTPHEKAVAEPPKTEASQKKDPEPS